MRGEFLHRESHLRGLRWLLLVGLLLASLGLSGCLRYEVGVTVDGQFSGSITQHITLSEQLTSFSQREAEDWLDTVEQRARRLQGRVQRVSASELVATIPFHNGQELATRFNQFFNPEGQTPAQAVPADAGDWVQLTAGAALQQTNLLLLERDRLVLDIDLRGLRALGEAGNTLAIDPGSLLDLEFALQTPWGARLGRGSSESALTPPVQRHGRRYVWRLQPGQVNHIEAAYWLPSLLGLGAVLIALLVAAGSYVKYKLFAAPVPASPR